MDKAEEFFNKADEPLEQAKILANLPYYLNQRLIHPIGDIARIN